MADPAKKFSFGFTKTTKRPNLSIKPRNDPKQGRQLIDCLEGKLIKVRGGDEKVEEKPLIIPLQPSSRRVLVKSENGESSQPTSCQNEQNSNLPEGVTIKQEPLDADEPSQPLQPNNISLVKIKTEPAESEPTTLDEIAAREILREAEETRKEEDYSNLAVPAIPNVDTLAAVSTEEDYENIPVSAFGKAMLKGMGWEAEKGVGKAPQVVATVEVTGPKRLAASSAEQKLRATQVRTGNTATNSEREELKLVKGAFVKILSGAMKSEYGEVEGFTDECDRVVVKMALRGGAVSFSEAALEVVSKSDFSKNSRILNSSKYEEVKNKVSKSLEQPSKSSSESSPERRDRSPGRRDKSPGRRDKSPGRRDRSPCRRDRSPGRRDKSPGRRDKSPGRRDKSPGRRDKSPGRRDKSPGRRDKSPGRRDKSPGRRDKSPDRRDKSPGRRDKSPGRRDKSPVRRDRSPVRRDRSPDSRRSKRDRSSSSERRPKQFRKTSLSPSPDRNRKKTDIDRKYARRDSPRKSTPPRRRRSLSSSPVRESSKKSSEKSKLESRSSRRSVSRSLSPRKSGKSVEKSRRDRSSDSDSDSRKKVKKSKKKHKKRSSSSSSSGSDSPKRSSHKKKKKSAKKKKSKKRDSSSSPERQKKSWKK